MLWRRRFLDEYLEITREVLLRLDRNASRMETEFRLRQEESRRYFEALHAQAEEHAEENRRRLDDVIAENRAQRQALLSILDRLDNGGAAPAT